MVAALPEFACRAADCLTDVQLRSLVEEYAEDSSDGELDDWTRHLDHCPQCRERLESLVADAESWREVRQQLNRTRLSPTLEIERLKAALLPSHAETLRASGSTNHFHAATLAKLLAGSDDGQPRRLGCYELRECLGQGGMGVVYKAWDTELHRHVAVKLMTSLTQSGESFRARFLREARALAAVQSDHVVQIFSIDEYEDVPFLVMEYVPGESLQSRLARRGALPWREAAEIARQVAAGLQAAHALGIVHRDVKPGNILLADQTGRVKLTDFGLARAQFDSDPDRRDQLAGTPEYISPEQASGREAGPASDQYSLGCVLYAMCAGQPPFEGVDPLTVLRRTVHDSLPPLTEALPQAPAKLVQIIERLLRKQPGERFASLAEVQAALQSLTREGEKLEVSQREANTNFRPWMLALGLAALLLVLTPLFGMSGYFFGGAQVAGKSDDPQPAADTAQPATDPQPKAPAAAEPIKVITVTPDSLLRESIREERNQAPPTPSPFELKQFTGHTGPVKDVAFTPDGKLLVSCSGWPVGDKTIRIWDLATGKELRQCDTSGIKLPTGIAGGREAPGEWVALDVSPDGQWVVGGGSDGVLGVWEIATGKLARQVFVHQASVYTVAFAPDGQSVLSAGREANAFLWNVRTGELSLTLPCDSGAVRAVAFSPDGKLGFAGSQGSNHLSIWDLAAAKKSADVPSARWIWSISHSPTAPQVAYATANEIRIYDRQKQAPVLCLQGHTRMVTSVSYSPDGTRLISTAEDDTVRVWDVQTGKELQLCLGHRGWVWKARFSPDGQTAASAGGGQNSPFGGAIRGQDFAIRLWKMPATKPRVAE